MKLLLVFALLALICMARSAPTSPTATTTTTGRQLVFQHYDDDDEHVPQEEVKLDDDDEHEAEDDETTTTTTRRSVFNFPTRNRNMIPSRRPIQTQSSTTPRSTKTTTVDDNQEGQTDDYNGDFKYIQNFRKYFQQLLEDIKKLVRNLTGYDLGIVSQRQQYPLYNE
ncbi:unnamed protein product [Adineta ricciae]|uniref:Uncharacterized protein n=1 Tax=Adineta ricciae TaxID=249248 RepID=A0A813U2V9_ADIRI|nr:unnamed protein product [Adineta ricciae]